jgi:tetrahydromethanopterin S-methyltransferase subunit B
MLTALVGTTQLDQLISLMGSVPLDVWPARDPVYPSRGNGFAAAILGALVGLGVLIVVMIFISSKPRNRRR